MAVPCNAGSVVGHYCPSQSRTQLYSGARTDAQPDTGCPPSERNKGINGQPLLAQAPIALRVRSAPTAQATHKHFRPSERRNRKINNQVRESERRTVPHIRARSYSRVRPSNPWRNKRDLRLP